MTENICIEFNTLFVHCAHNYNYLGIVNSAIWSPPLRSVTEYNHLIIDCHKVIMLFRVMILMTSCKEHWN